MSTGYDLEDEDVQYVSELAEYSDERIDALSDGFWRRLEYAKVLHEKLEERGVDVTPRPNVDDEDLGDIVFGMSAEDEGDELGLPDEVPGALAFTWDDAPTVLNVVAEEGGEVVKVDAWKHEQRSFSNLGITVSVPRLHQDE